MNDLNGARAAVLIDLNTGLPITPAKDASIQSLIAVIQAQIDLTDLFVTDGTNYYVREVTLNEGTGAKTVTFLNMDGTTPGTAPTVANLRPVGAGTGAASSGISPVTGYFDVVTAGTGYAVGDQLLQVLFLNTATQAVSGTAWYNVTKGTAISAPTAANVVEQDQNVKVSGTVAISALPGSPAQDGTDPASPVVANQGTGIRGWLATQAALLKLGTANKASSGSVTIATDQGNLEPGGTAITGTAMPAGGVGLTGWFSALWALLTAANQRAVIYTDTSNANVAANGTAGAVAHDAGASPSAFTKVSAFFYASQASITNGAQLLGTDDQANFYVLGQATLAAGGSALMTVPNVFRYYYAKIANGGNAGTTTIKVAFTTA